MDNEILKQGQKYTDPSGNTGIVNFDVNTGKRLKVGGTTQSNVITSADLNQNVKPYTLPPRTPLTTADGLGGYIESGNQNLKTESDRLRAEREAVQETKGTELETTLSQILGTNTEIATAGSKIDRSAEDKARKEADKYTSEIEAEQLSNRRRIEALQNKNPEGLFDGGLEQEVNRINRESVSKQADLAILQNSALRNYTTANAIADRQLVLKLEPLKAKLDNLKFFYSENKADFNKEDDRLYNEAIKKADNEFKKQEEIEKQIKDIKMMAVQNQAPASTITKLSTAKTVDEALQIAGKFGTDYLATEIKKATLANLYKKEGSSAPEIKKINGEDMQWDGSKWVPVTTGGGIPDKQFVSRIDTKIKSLENILSNDTGINSSAGLWQKHSIMEANKVNDWRADAINVIQKLTVDELGRIKSDGVTFGQLSNGERVAVGDAATALSAAAERDKEGNPTGRFKMSEDKVKEEFQKILNGYTLDFERKTGVPYQEYKQNPDIISPEEIYLNTIGGALQNTNNPYALYTNQ